MSDCEVCTEKYNKSTRRVIECGHCHQRACTLCVRQYLLGTITSPHCMSCKVPWTSEFIRTTFTKVFVEGELRKHQERVLVEGQKALLPETQLLVTRERVIHEAKLLGTMANFYKREGFHAQYEEYTHKLELLRGDFPWLADNGLRKVPENEPKNLALRRCIDEECRGYIMSKGHSCSACGKRMCARCMADITDPAVREGHQCAEEDVETAKLLLRDTKPCPGCGIMISKIEGCSQMWCTGCHTTFDWSTGEKVEGTIHNPHYYEYLRRNGGIVPRHPQDVPGGQQPLLCGREMPTDAQLASWLDTLARKQLVVPKLTRDILLSGRFVGTHIWRIELGSGNRRQTIEVEEVDAFTKLRKDYLRKQYDENEWKRLLYLKRRDTEFRMEQFYVFDLAQAQIADTYAQLQRLVNAETAPTIDMVEEQADAMGKVVVYCNEALRLIAKTYKKQESKQISLREARINYTKI